QTGLDSFTIAGRGFVQLRRDPVVQNGVEVLRVPAESDRQRLQCAPTPAALDGAMLNLANDRLRNVRPFRKFALTPAELVDAPAYRLRDCRPVLRPLRLRALPQRGG